MGVDQLQLSRATMRLTPPVDTAELLLHVPSRSVTLLAALRSPWAAASRGRARTARGRASSEGSMAAGGARERWRLRGSIGGGGERRQAESRRADGKKHATQLCAWD